jgi:hypothetical protein
MSGPGNVLPQQRLRSMQVLAGTLLLGVLVFLGIALILVQREGQGLGRQQAMPVTSYTALAFLAVVLVLWYFLPAQMAKQQVRKIAAGTWAPWAPESRRTPNPGLPSSFFRTDTDKLLGVFLATSLIAWALLESIGFMGCMAYLMEAQPFVFGVVGAAVLLLFMTFPTRDRVSRWLEEQQARIAEIRQSEGLPSVPRDPVDAEINQLKERITELERKKRERRGESLD